MVDSRTKELPKYALTLKPGRSINSFNASIFGPQSCLLSKIMTNSEVAWPTVQLVICEENYVLMGNNITIYVLEWFYLTAVCSVDQGKAIEENAKAFHNKLFFKTLYVAKYVYLYSD